jgi:hypothetical protein
VCVCVCVRHTLVLLPNIDLTVVKSCTLHGQNLHRKNAIIISALEKWAEAVAAEKRRVAGEGISQCSSKAV